MTPKHILVATDLSPSAEAVYSWAAALARRFAARVTLLNVDETSEFGWPMHALGSGSRLKLLLDEVPRKRKQLLAEALELFEREEVETAVVKVSGRASDCILDWAASSDVDLLVLGRRGARLTERFNLGSTTKRVLRRVRAPALVVPRGGEEPRPEPLSGRRIIAATAFSGVCLMALDATLELAQLLQASVDVVHVIRLPSFFSLQGADWPQMVRGEAREALEHLHERDLTDTIGAGRAGRCSPVTVLGNSVADALRELSQESGADLIALPSHRADSPRPPRFGSTAENVVRRSLVPVLVYPVHYLEQRFGMKPANA